MLPALQKLSYAGKHLDDAQRTLEHYGIPCERDGGLIGTCVQLLAADLGPFRTHTLLPVTV